MQVSVPLHRYAIEDWGETLEFALMAERFGVDSLWSAGAWAHDGATPLAWLMAQKGGLRRTALRGSNPIASSARSRALRRRDEDQDQVVIFAGLGYRLGRVETR